tara:strand:+ start:531 stop:926 length:396 start_codon:yes stop_codon:yes gene_type:complete
MTTMKTQENDASIEDFINTLDDPQKREDCRALVDLFTRASKQTPRMWGTGIVGFGKHHYQYANGKPGEICKVGFAPRAKSLAFYLTNFPERAALLEQLGKHKFSGGCLHINKLDAVDMPTLETIVGKAYHC